MSKFILAQQKVLCDAKCCWEQMTFTNKFIKKKNFASTT